ncbi:MAG: YicC/YloC family endoribonuclease [Pelagimonas sp.]|uniref:YicC/YloC family endoribonuclease n=1 Tax=Pelagimonas sp. TaxID=2073170 RepID=UPI003D6B38A5
MRQSMTGFASKQGSGHGFVWGLEMRGVNGKGLDLRLRMPDWIEGLEIEARKRLNAALSRGNVQVSLRLNAEGAEGAVRLDTAQLEAVLNAMNEIETQAMNKGLSLAPSTAADIVGLRGVLTSETGDVDHATLRASILSDFDEALTDFVKMRDSEGQKLTEILNRQLSEVDSLVNKAEILAQERAPEQAQRLKTQLARVLDNTDSVDDARVAQELAMLAVKADVTEEIDRLRAHIAAAHELMETKGSVGRKFDFLMQEFNREANTLCSKSGDAELTRVGLSLKTLIDQMREQVQNVE